MSAKIDLKFIDSNVNDDFIKVECYEYPDSGIEEICIEGVCSGNDFMIMLNKSTAIKFAKTLRTEINKIKE